MGKLRYKKTGTKLSVSSQRQLVAQERDATLSKMQTLTIVQHLLKRHQTFLLTTALTLTWAGVLLAWVA